MWRFLTALRNREPRLSAPRAKKSQARKRPATCRPRLELLEDRLVLDVGDSFGSALLTGLGPTVGSYTMPSEYIGDGRFKNLDVDLYQFTGKSGELIKAVTSPPATGNVADTYLWLFDAAGDRQPGILVRLPQDRWYASSMLCSHNNCKLMFVRDLAMARDSFSVKATNPILGCPCHFSVFDIAQGGKVMTGPAPKPPLQLRVRIAGGTAFIEP